MKYKIYHNKKRGVYIIRHKKRICFTDFIFLQDLKILYLDDGEYYADIEYGIDDYLILTKIK